MNLLQGERVLIESSASVRGIRAAPGLPLRLVLQAPHRAARASTRRPCARQRRRSPQGGAAAASSEPAGAREGDTRCRERVDDEGPEPGARETSRSAVPEPESNPPPEIRFDQGTSGKRRRARRDRGGSDPTGAGAGPPASRAATTTRRSRRPARARGRAGRSPRRARSVGRRGATLLLAPGGTSPCVIELHATAQGHRIAAVAAGPPRAGSRKSPKSSGLHVYRESGTVKAGSIFVRFASVGFARGVPHSTPGGHDL